MINLYECVTKPEIIKTESIIKILERIKNPDKQTKQFIEQARYLLSIGDIDSYNHIKRNLPCVTFNFEYEKWKKDKNIVRATGFIYIDVDNSIELDLKHPLIYASWKSLSGKGRGVLVKTRQLNHNNFNYTYNSICSILGIKGDSNARKLSQFTILSYDPDIYINRKSIEWNCAKEFKKSPNSKRIKKKKKVTSKLGENNNLKYDDIHLIDFESADYIFFPQEKGSVSKAWIPEKISNGKRNSTITAIAIQLKALNPEWSSSGFKKFVLKLNSSRCETPLPIKEVLSIVKSVEKMKNITPKPNIERRIIFNPKSKLSKSEKIKISNKLIGEVRQKNTIVELKNAVMNWDFSRQGKITQIKLALQTNKNIKTVERYYAELKPTIQKLNSEKA